ncbi:putative addiction module component [Planktothrix sp. PCC 11201]|uniref:addiction module protein n=1 Tax=Planktothrix sp. PCC 11201 TaxID=1729650 RepID=UPI000912B7AC|nr:addiction module protein [Planktothrix sp. PCC 11201]SKB14772.1 putative addiction module component [Planktothrix sp. PCC 11201]
MRTVEELITEALSLPSASRVLLVEKLVESLEFDVDETIQTLWITEAKQRRDEIRTGVVQPIPGEEALSQILRSVNYLASTISYP